MNSEEKELLRTLVMIAALVGGVALAASGFVVAFALALRLAEK